MLDPFSEDMIDDNEALIRQFPSVDTEARRNQRVCAFPKGSELRRMPDDQDHAHKMQKQTSETYRRDLTSNLFRTPNNSGPHNLESQRRAKK